AEARAPLRPAATYHQSFVHQLLNLAAAARGKETLRVPGEEGLQSLRLIEQCYRSRKLMPMPWLSEAELKSARELAAA
ncbi:MAG: hypothetical protein HY301_14470, partial [Verrucomicrobia bacterium]|nr:hypothetical protein [Verrucomicrobiota bacterium]